MSSTGTGTVDVLKGLHKPDGSFNRAPSSFRDVIEKGGRFEPEKGDCDKPSSISFSHKLSSAHHAYSGRYHLFVSYGCRKSSYGILTGLP